MCSERFLNVVLYVAIGLLDLAGGLFALAFGFCSLVAGYLASGLLDRTLDLFGHAGKLILIHHFASPGLISMCERERAGG